MEPDILYSSIAWISFQPISLYALVYLVISFLLLFLLAVVTASEIAFYSLSQHSIREFEDSSEKKHQRIIKLIKFPKRLDATLFLSNTFLSVAFVLVLIHFISSILFSTLFFVELTIEVLIVSFLLLVFGLLLPKNLAHNAPKETVLFTAPVILFFEWVLAPFIALLTHVSFFSPSLFRHQNRSSISMEDLTHALELTSNSDDDTEILEGIIKFGNIQVKEIMTSRVDMMTVDMKLNYRELLDVIIDSGYSRIPIYSSSKDNIKGVIYIKDLLPYFDKSSSFKWQTLARVPYYVPETKKIDDLLNEFQTQKIHMALVVDEYGVTSGLITMEDIIEEIVGDISDEYDEDQKLMLKLDINTFIFEAKIQLNDFFKLDEIEESDFENVGMEVETLAGLILELKGEIPSRNERIEFGKYVFQILSVDNRRIKKVKLFIK